MTEAGALRRLETLCARSEHSEGELLEKMRRWGLSDEGAGPHHGEARQDALRR